MAGREGFVNDNNNKKKWVYEHQQTIMLVNLWMGIAKESSYAHRWSNSRMTKRSREIGP